MGYDMVTRCDRRVIGDIQLRTQQAHVHYEITSGPNRFPDEVRMSIWTQNKALDTSPTQSARYYRVGDTSYLDVADPTSERMQRTQTVSKGFPYLPNYVGLFEQLVGYLNSRPDRRVALQLLSVNASNAEAEIYKRTKDSVFLRIDSVEYSAAWNDEMELLGAVSTKPQTMIVRLPLPAGDDPDRRCKQARPPGTLVQTLNGMFRLRGVETYWSESSRNDH